MYRYKCAITIRAWIFEFLFIEVYLASRSPLQHRLYFVLLSSMSVYHCTQLKVISFALRIIFVVAQRACGGSAIFNILFAQTPRRRLCVLCECV